MAVILAVGTYTSAAAAAETVVKTLRTKEGAAAKFRAAAVSTGRIVSRAVTSIAVSRIRAAKRQNLCPFKDSLTKKQPIEITSSTRKKRNIGNRRNLRIFCRGVKTAETIYGGVLKVSIRCSALK